MKNSDLRPRWWEGLVRFLSNYWWLLLIIIAVGVTIYFTRDIWGMWL
jgi:hypothetical protein